MIFPQMPDVMPKSTVYYIPNKIFPVVGYYNGLPVSSMLFLCVFLCVCVCFPEKHFPRERSQKKIAILYLEVLFNLVLIVINPDSYPQDILTKDDNIISILPINISNCYISQRRAFLLLSEMTGHIHEILFPFKFTYIYVMLHYN